MKSLENISARIFSKSVLRSFFAMLGLLAILSLNIGQTITAENLVFSQNQAEVFQDLNGNTTKRTTSVDKNGNVSQLATFCNTTPIVIPTGGNSTPYPSTIPVAGELSSITSVTVDLLGYSHDFPDDVDIMLVGPGAISADSLYVMSDVGDATPVTGLNFTISDAAATIFPDLGPLVAGTFRPTNVGASDNMVGATPTTGQNAAPSGAATFASVFNGKAPNGNWNLYVRDQFTPDAGTISGGWCVNITSVGSAPTVQFSAATYNTVEGLGATITVNRLGDTVPAVTVDYATSAGTATAGADYTNTTGTLTFGTGVTTQTFNITIFTDVLSEDPPETVNLTLSNPTGGATINAPNPATLNIQDAATQYIGGAITIVDNANATPYPSSITVAGAPMTPGRVRMTLRGLTHTFPGDIEMLLVSPTGATFVPMGQAGGSADVNSVIFTLEDAATTILPELSIIAADNYEPANYGGLVADFVPPAPIGPYGDTGSTFNLGGPNLNTTFNGNPNGVWNLFVRDVAVGDVGDIAGWALEFIPNLAASASVSGRVSAANGNGINNAIIEVSGGSLTEPRRLRTSSFGYYQVDDLEVGQTYVLTVQSKRFVFANPSIVLTVQENVGDVNFEAIP